MEKVKTYFLIIINILLHIAGAVALIVLLPKLLGFFWPFVAAWIIASIANPLVRFMDHKINIRRRHGTVITVILVLGIVVALLYGIVHFLVGQVTSLIDNLPQIYQQIEAAMNETSANLSGFYLSLPEPVQNMVTSIGNSLENFVADLFRGEGSGSSAISVAGSATRSILDVVLNTVIMLVSAYFFIADREKIAAAARHTMPAAIMNKIDMVVSYFKRAVGGYFYAQFKIMIVLVILMTVWFGLMKVPYYGLLALITGFLNFLPVFGTGTILGPWAVYCFFTGEYLRMALLIALYVVCQIVHQTLQPKMVADSIGISPIMTLFLLFMGYQYKGVIGMIVALPVGLVVINFYRAGMFNSIMEQIRYLCRGIAEALKIEIPEQEEK